MTRRLGVRWEVPDNGIAEIANVAEGLRVEFSRRSGDVQRRVDEKLDRFADSMGREPTPRERWRLEREAVVDSRPTEPKALGADVLHHRWAEQTAALGLDPAEVVETAVGHVPPGLGIDRSAAAMVIDRAMTNIAEGQSTWRPAELVRELAAVVPTTNGVEADRLVEWVDQMATGVAVSRCVDISRPVPSGVLVRRDGRPVSESAIDRALTTQAILDQEAGLLGWADRRTLHSGHDHPDAAFRSARSLDGIQAQAAAAIAGYDDLVLILGPAGTGKTTALAPAVEQLRADGRAVFGVAPSATAADVLSAETGLAADTLDKLLVEHRLHRPPDHRYDLPVGATVIVDEAGMVPTARLAELADLADVHGWRIALIGDPLQFSAVGRGGMFGLLVDTFDAVELDRVHRFHQPWERDASLRLRHGDPDIADVYEDHGRLHGGTPDVMERAAVIRWWDHRQAGETVALMAPTIETTDRLNQRAQQLRIRAGELDPEGRSVQAGTARVYVNDEIATRRNDRQLVTDRGEMVRNRATWTITAIYPDGSLTATGRHGTVRLPARYVADHVELAYASTAAAAQGRTVDHAVVVADRPCDVRNLYVAMSRGSHTNHAYLATQGEHTAHDVFVQCLVADWIDQPAHSRRTELAPEQPHRAGLLDGAALRDLLERRHQLTSELELAQAREWHLPGEIRHAETAKVAAEQAIAEIDQQERANEALLAEYDRPLRRRRHQTEITAAGHDLADLPHRRANAQRDLATAQDTLTDLDRDGAEARTILARRGDIEADIGDLDDQITHDLRTRTRVTRREQPEAITAVLGPRPALGQDARVWDTAAGRLAQHQAAFNTHHGLGPQPDYYDRSAYRDSHQAVADVVQPLTPPVIDRSIELPDLGLSL